MLRLYFDGAIEPVNPGGCASYGWVLKSGDVIVAQGHGVVSGPGPESTNNVAEYGALIAGLEAFVHGALRSEPVEVCGDSRLVLEQVAGRWKCKAKHLRPFLFRAKALVAKCKRLTLRWIPREENAEADALSRRADGLKDLMEFCDER